jgi:hypothetical protein
VRCRAALDGLMHNRVLDTRHLPRGPALKEARVGRDQREAPVAPIPASESSGATSFSINCS